MKKMLVILLAMLSIGFAASAFAGQGWDISFQNNSWQTTYYISPITSTLWHENDLGKTIEVSKGCLIGSFYTEAHSNATNSVLVLGVYDNATICDSNLVGVIVMSANPDEKNYQNALLNSIYSNSYDNAVSTLAMNATTQQTDGYDHYINLSPWMYFAAPFSGNPINATIVLTSR